MKTSLSGLCRGASPGTGEFWLPAGLAPGNPHGLRRRLRPSSHRYLAIFRWLYRPQESTEHRWSTLQSPSVDCWGPL